MTSLASHGDWICTFSGHKFFINDPQPEDVFIEDIAHALSLNCRFAGHVRRFYSIAQHSVLVKRQLERLFPDDLELHLHGLMHDFSEAYLSDVVRPLKQQMPAYRILEARTMEVIYRAFGVPEMVSEDAELVKRSDNSLLMTERRDLINHQGRAWTTTDEPDPVFDLTSPWTPEQSEEILLREWANTYRPFMQVASI